MGYDRIHGDLVEEDDEDGHHDDGPNTHPSPSPSPAAFQPLASQPLGLYLDENTRNTETQNHSPGTALSQIFHSVTSGRSKNSYDIVEDDDYEAPSPLNSPPLSIVSHREASVSSPSPRSPADTTGIGPFVPIDLPRPHAIRPPPSYSWQAASANNPRNPSRSGPAKPILRTASGRSVDLRHPTPDLQVLQGAYVGNIEQLERTAEQLSMTSSIDDAIRDLHMEQKRNDSRRSSILSSPEYPGTVQRNVSNASSIREANNIARSGGYSPAGFMMSPIGSLSTTSGRIRSGSGAGSTVSRTSRFGTRPEPEQEGRPLDSLVSIPAMPPMPYSASIAEQDESPGTFTTGLLDPHDVAPEVPEHRAPQRPASPSASINTFEVQQAFADFDGVHDPEHGDDGLDYSHPGEISMDRPSMSGSDTNNHIGAPSLARPDMARPKSYMDPSNGQEMVYYPAPVPMMLNLPQKLSKLPSSMARNKRRTQAMSSIPPQARQSAIWLPDVLETDDQPDLAEDDGAQGMEYVAQHQRATMGGRRLTQDVQHLPPQLRATVYFDLAAVPTEVQVKEQSAVATLDSILDASAHAPVNAFTDHAFAGHLGAEVYGKSTNRHIRKLKSASHLAPIETETKRASTFSNLLGRGKRATSSTSNLQVTEDEKRRNTIADVRDGKILRDDDEEDRADAAALRGSDSEEEEDEEYEREDYEMYEGAPTTLLAELQLRKQQQKERIRPVASYTNGMHATLLEMDAVARVEQDKRKLKRVNLAWEDPALEQPDVEDNDDDVPLALLYSKKTRVQEPNRPMGLMERRDMEDNEPLSRRRDRLQGRPVRPHITPRQSTMNPIKVQTPTVDDEEETLAQRIQRLKNAEPVDDGIPLPKARPVSGDFASEMMSQFGGPATPLSPTDPKWKGKAPELPTPPPEEEETMGQRRKRLQAEKEAREKNLAERDETTEEERPVLDKRHSMATILQAHPSATAGRVSSQEKPAQGLLGMHDKAAARKSITMNLDTHRRSSYGNTFKEPAPQLHAHQGNNAKFGALANGGLFPQPSLGYGGYGNGVQLRAAAPQQPMMGYGMGNMGNRSMSNMGMPMNYTMPNMHMPMQMQMQNPMGLVMPGMGMGMGMGVEPLNQGQVDMVERWRQSVMH